MSAPTKELQACGPTHGRIPAWMLASYVTSYEICLYVNVKTCVFQLFLCLHSHMLQLGSEKGGVIAPEQCILASPELQGEAVMFLPLPSEITVILKMCLPLCDSAFHYGKQSAAYHWPVPAANQLVELPVKGTFACIVCLSVHPSTYPHIYLPVCLSI